MTETTQIKVNRAPVLTLWAAVVAERLGYDQDTTVTLGKAVAGLNAASKARRLGIVEGPIDPREARETRGRTPDEPLLITVVGRPVPAIRTEEGIRATRNGQPINPAGVRRYLKQRFSHALDDVQAATETLAKTYPPDQLAAQAYALYESFRPAIPEGEIGWGAAGPLDLDHIRSLAQ
jgi:hypothetical protein